MHRVSLQRVDRCSMRHQVEIREPFLDPSVVKYALGLDAAALVEDVTACRRGKAPLRDLYDLYPDRAAAQHSRPHQGSVREGAGLDVRREARPGSGVSMTPFRMRSCSTGESNSRSSISSRKRNCSTFASLCAGDGHFPRAASARPCLDFVPGPAKSRKAQSVRPLQPVIWNPGRRCPPQPKSIKRLQRSSPIPARWKRISRFSPRRACRRLRITGDGKAAELRDALLYNRRLWTIFVASVTKRTQIRSRRTSGGMSLILVCTCCGAPFDPGGPSPRQPCGPDRN